MKVSELQSRIGIFELVNKLLRESFSNKQKLLKVFLEHNSVLIKQKLKHVENPNDKHVSFNESTYDSQNHMGLDKSNEKKCEHTKTLSNARNNSEKSQTDRSNNGTKAYKDSDIIVDDSVIKHVNGYDISHSHAVKVRPNPGKSTDHLMDNVKPAMPRKAESPGGDPYRYE